MDHTHYITGLLKRWQDDKDASAEDELFRAVQRELLRMAQGTLQKHPGFTHKVDPRELLNEAYLALKDYPIVTANRKPFFKLMANAMRHVLMDIGRAHNAAKRPSTKLRVMDTNAVDSKSAYIDVDAIAYYEALDQLEQQDERAARIVEAIDVVGLSIQEAADMADVAPATLKRTLAKGRAFMTLRLDLGQQSV